MILPPASLSMPPFSAVANDFRWNSPEPSKRNGATKGFSSSASDGDGLLLLMTSRRLAWRFDQVNQATKNALGQEDDEQHQQHAVDQIVPADRLGAETDAQH